MKPLESWLGRKKASLCLMAGLCAVSLCVIVFSGGRTRETGGGSYAVKIRHYGVDAREMERSVSIPLEDALSAIPGLCLTQSSSENGLSRVFARFDRRGRGQYEAVREAAQRVYETLPSSAQRPEIQSSDNSRIPVWSAAVFSVKEGGKSAADTALLLERTVKPGLESLAGAGEIIISGAGLTEIIVAVDQEKAAALNIVSSAAAALARNDALFSGGTARRGDREIILTVDGRYPDIGEALIPLGEGRSVKLAEIAVIEERERLPDILSRLNGKRTAVISMMGSSGADLRKLSADIKRTLSAMPESLEFTVLADRGAEEAAAFRSVFSAALQGALMVGLIGFLLNRGTSRAGVFCALAVPGVCLVSAAALSIAGFPLDRWLLAGIAAGVGAAVDSVILCSEKLGRCENYGDAAAALRHLRSPLVAGAATTAAALLPLSAVEEGGAGIIASAIAVVTLTALFLSLSLLPPLLLWDMRRAGSGRSGSGPRVIRHLRLRLFRLLCRFLAADIRLCARRPAWIAAAGIVISAAAVLALFARGADPGTAGSEDSVYAQVEFDGGLLAEEADRLLAAYGERLSAAGGVKNVETGARTGSGTLLVSFDPKALKSAEVRELARRIQLPGGFLFFPETSKKERYWEIKITGDDDIKCGELAEELARLSAGHPLVREQVLNFKEGGKKLLLLPDREILSESGTGFSSAAGQARMGVHGPVAYKRTGAKSEIDVRVMTVPGVMRQLPSREEVMGILVSAGNGALRLDTLTREREKTESSSIRREGRRRCASITVSTRPMDPRRVRRELSVLFRELDLPPGYSVEFDPEAIRRAEALSGTVISLILALVFCYMVIAAVNESFTLPLVVLSAVPPSLAVPALCLAASGGAFNPSAACAFVAVSGMTVNAAVLCAGGLEGGNRLALYRVLRKKLPALLATAGTTVAGALPFLFLREGANSLVRTLALVSALGVGSSCLCAISVVPALSILMKRFLNAGLVR